MQKVTQLTQKILELALENSNVTKLSEQIGISRSQLHRIINGKSQPNAQQLQDILNASDMTAVIMPKDKAEELKENAELINNLGKLVGKLQESA